MRKALVSWSSGKDSAYALQRARQDDSIEVVGLLTTVSQAYERVAMHGVRRVLLERQAEAVGLPVYVVELPSPCSNERYEALMGEFVSRARGMDIEAVVFGDLFLEDIRAYRERQLEGSGLAPLFPLWGCNTQTLAREMLDAGVVAHLTCLDPRKLPKALAGRRWDADLIASLPEGVDPCGEYGEFHTFVSDGPAFNKPVVVEAGEVVERDGFVFADLLAR